MCNSDSDCGPSGSGGQCSRPSHCAHSYCTAGDSIPAGKDTCELPRSALQTPACYYRADDAPALSQRLEDIVDQLTTCTYQLDVPPPEDSRLFVYLDVNGTLTRVERDPAHANGWDVSTDGASTRVDFFGPSCDQVRNGEAIPRVFYGCTESGG